MEFGYWNKSSNELTPLVVGCWNRRQTDIRNHLMDSGLAEAKEVLRDIDKKYGEGLYFKKRRRGALFYLGTLSQKTFTLTLIIDTDFLKIRMPMPLNTDFWMVSIREK